MTHQMAKPTKIEASRNLVKLIVKEFRGNYPDLNLNSLGFAPPSSIENVKLTQKQICQIDLHPIVLSTICGTTFGDSSLVVHSNYKNARLNYRHSTRQTDWFLWKTLCVFKELASEEGIQFQLPDGFQAAVHPNTAGELLGKLKMSTNVNSKLTQLRDIIAPNNVKTIERNWLNHMNNYFLMTLWLDDGSLIGGLGRQGILSTGAMPLKQTQLLADYLKKVWGIKCDARELTKQPMKNGMFQTRLFIKDQESLMKFLKIIAPIIPVKSMLYKVCFFPETVSLQQRWASELKELVRPEWHDALDQIYFYKRIKFLVSNNSEEDIVH
jgi:hypothetical protein